MRFSLSGLAFLLGYIVLVGMASFLQKFSMNQLNPYQINFLMALGMLGTAVPALWLKQGSLSVPLEALPLGAPNRIDDGFGFNLLRASVIQAAGGDDRGNLYELPCACSIALTDILG